MSCKGCIYAYREHGHKKYSKRLKIDLWIKGTKEMCVIHGNRKKSCKDKVIEEG